MIKKLILVAAVLTSSLCVCEILLRVYQLDGAERLPAYVVDEQTGFSLLPNQHGFIIRRVPGLFRTQFHTNSRGMRDREYVLEKHDRRRVLALGDSITEGWGVEAEEAYPNVLASQYLHDVEVWNLGVAGYSTDQELQQLRQVIDDYRPDVVTLAFYFNDLAENSFRRVRWPPRYIKPHFDFRGNDLVLANEQELRHQKARAGRKDRTLTALTDRLLNRSALYRLVLYSSATLIDQSKKRKRGGEAVWWGLDHLYRTNQGGAELNQAWALTERILAEVNRLCASRGARFVMTYVPQPIDGVPGMLQTQLRMITEDDLGEFDGGVVEGRLADAARRQDIDFVPMRERFLNAPHPASLFLARIPEDPHIAAPGHQLVARALAEHLRRVALLPTRNFRSESLVETISLDTTREQRQRP